LRVTSKAAPQGRARCLRDSGLLGLIIPREFGGLGESWASTLQIVRELARVDSSVAHVFAFQHLLLATAQLFGRPDQWQPWFEQTVRERWFWGNALNPLDTRTLATPDGDGYRFTGDKSFCSGATDSDMLLASALRAGRAVC
jgi:alkylation response protein AidB-like acyl-CoA dehydrogenase